MDGVKSSYYPPRARRWGSIHSGWFQLKRELRLNRLGMVRELLPWELVLGFLVPGYGFHAGGMKRTARVCYCCYGLGWLIFIAALGFPASNIAFGLLIGLHATSAAFAFSRLSSAASYRWIRWAITATVLVALCGYTYFPARNLILRHAMPLEMGGQVFIINPSASHQSLRRGDYLVHYIPGGGHNQVALQSGYGIDRIIAVAGDHVRFRPYAIDVNGVPQPKLHYAPAKGELIVPPRHWFVLPNLAMMGNNQAVSIDDVWMSAALVEQQHYQGQPFRHWFGRSQLLP